MSNFNVGFKNIGPVEKANFEIRPLTIFIGPNNSGKSIMSAMIHSLTKALKDTQIKEDSFVISKENLFFKSQILFNGIKNKFKESIKKDFIEYLSSDNDFEKIPFVIHKELINNVFNESVGRSFANEFSNSLTKLFNDLDILKRYGSENFEITYKGLKFEEKDNNIILKKSNIKFHNDAFILKFSANNGETDFFDDNEIEIKFLCENGNILLYFDSNHLNLFLKRIVDLNLDSASLLEYSLDRSVLRLSLGYQFNDEDNEKILAELFLDLFVKVLGHNFTEYIFNQNSYYLPVGRTEVLDNIIKIISKLLNSENSSYTQIQ